MPRGKRDIERTRRILQKILDRVPFKIIAFEEGASVPFVSAIRTRYVTKTVALELNKAGKQLMDQEQLPLQLRVK